MLVAFVLHGLSLAAFTAATAVDFVRNFKPEGAWGDHGQEASPFFLGHKLYMMQSIMGRFPADGSQGGHSGFCVYDAETGEVVSCPDSSSAFAFCSAVVDRSAAPQKLWVFCSAWDRANHSYCADSAWGCGACADAQHGRGHGCVVASWSTEDLGTWDGPHPALTLPMNQTVPNVGVSMVAAAAAVPGLPMHQAFMALENSAYPIVRQLRHHYHFWTVSRAFPAPTHPILSMCRGLLVVHADCHWELLGAWNPML